MNRTQSIDLLRGTIMIFMALDHASAMIARVHFTEIWGVDFSPYPDIAWWFTRFISHLCAPGFFFLMGMSIYLFAQKRLSASWTPKQIYTYFIKRGTMILLFMLFLEIPAWIIGFYFNQLPSSSSMPGHVDGFFIFPTTVLYGLGACMIIGGFLWKLKPWQLGLLSISSFVGSAFYISTLHPADAFHPLEHFLIVPGMSTGAMVLYPIIPWIGVVCFGIFWGKIVAQNQDKIFVWSLQTGLSFMLIFLLIRFLAFGNFQHNAYEDWISFFTLIKYPPSIVFILITCGLNLMLLALFTKLTNKTWLKPVLLFGQTAMFFYILHLYCYAIIGILFPTGTSIGTMYLVWFSVLFILYFSCQRFLDFKRSKPLNSLWRMV